MQAPDRTEFLFAGACDDFNRYPFFKETRLGSRCLAASAVNSNHGLPAVRGSNLSFLWNLDSCSGAGTGAV